MRGSAFCQGTFFSSQSRVDIVDRVEARLVPHRAVCYVRMQQQFVYRRPVTHHDSDASGETKLDF